jgi:type II secretory pathway component PulL
MFRTVLTLVLLAGALYLAITRRGLAIFGSNRRVLVAALAVLGVLQVYRLVSAWQAQKRGDRLKRIPKRPLGI